MIGFSRVLEVNPKSDNIVWEFRDESPLHFYASNISGCQRLPNGNTLICEGTTGRFFEVTPDKELVWEYVSPLYFETKPPSVLGWTNAVFRTYRYAPDYPGLKGRILDPNRFELTLRKKPAGEMQALEKRLSSLGY